MEHAEEPAWRRDNYVLSVLTTLIASPPSLQLVAKKLMKPAISRVLIGVLFLPAISLAQVAEEGDWIVRVGVHDVDPKSNNSPVVNVDSDVQVTFDFTYLFSDDWAIEVLAAVPFEHGISLLDGTPVATTKHLPPTISFQYRFGGNDKVQPYVGAGVNHTIFSSEKTFGALAGTSLDLDSSTGLALQVGVDIALSDRMLFNAVLRSIDIETDASLDGVPLTTVKIDPLAIGINIGWKF